MSKEFVVDYRSNEDLDWLVALNLAFEGSGSALIMSSALINYAQGIIAGLVLVAIGIMFLLLHLGNRLKCWRVIARLKDSWISRGAFFAGGLIFFGVLSLFPLGDKLVYAVRIGTMLFAFLTIIYSGFFLSSMTPIPFWNTPLTPVLFLLHSVVTGLSILMFILVLSEGGPSVHSIIGWVVLMDSMALIFTATHVMVMATSTSAARESVKLLLGNGSRLPFLGGAVVLGLIVPLIISSYLYFSTGVSAPDLIISIAVTLALRAIGDYAFRSSFLNAGVYEMMI